MKKLHQKLSLLILTLLLPVVLVVPFFIVKARNDDEIVVTANFSGREISPADRIELTLNRTLKTDEGRLAIFIGESDLSSLFIFDAQTASYKPNFQSLPVGENNLTVYLVLPDGNWKQISELPLKVTAQDNANSNVSDNSTISNKSKTNVEFTPNVSLNIKGQNQTSAFPREAIPERNPFTDLAGQGTFSLKVSRRGWNFNSQFDFAGSSFRQEALRFGELGEKAPNIDLSSFLMEVSKNRFKANFGHVSFGSNRHLINSFSSRGITVTVPVSKQNEVSFAAMNGTSIVGFDNFIGVTRRKHNVLSATFAREFIKERPNGLRMEFSIMRGSLLPLANVNQGIVNDAERSLGFGFRVIGSDKTNRLRFEGGVSRSKFTNPNDPLLEQDFNVTEIKEVWKIARFAEVSFDFVRGLKSWREKEIKLTGTFRHEEIQPLFRSIGASTQADRHQNQFEISASFGEMMFVYGNLRDRDNLGEIATILKTLNRRQNAIFSLPLNSFFTTEKPIKWLPQISYTYDFVHQFGAFLPSNGDFRELSQVPDQKSFVQSFNATWQLSDKFNLAYRYNQAFQDNRQEGRENADFRSQVNAFTIGTKPFSDIDLDFELSEERQNNIEQIQTDNTFRFSTRTTWRTPFLKNSTFNANISTTFLGNSNRTSESDNIEFDVQWAYRFSFGEKKFKKMETQFFIRYTNRYANTIDRIFFANNFNKAQTFNFGLNFNFF